MSPRNPSQGASHHEEIGVSTHLSRRPGGTVATIVISNPQRLNSLNTHVLNSLISSASKVRDIPDLRCVIVTGATRQQPSGPSPGKPNAAQAFVGGADLSELATLPDAAAGRDFIRRLHLACQALRELPVPVLARVNGHALGGGLLVMAAADYRIATSGATFGMPEVLRGVPSTIESALLPGIIGAARARRLLMFGETIAASTAEAWGLVEKVVEPEKLDEEVKSWLEMVWQLGPQAVQGQKRLMRVWERVGIEEAIEAGIWEFGRAFEGGPESEARKLTTAFLQRAKGRKDSRL